MNSTTYNLLFGNDITMESITDSSADTNDYDNYKPYTFISGKISWNEPYRFHDGTFRPKCLNIGCDNPVALARGNIYVSKNRTLRTVCNSCHTIGYKKQKLPSGIVSVKKEYCENIDGRLGEKCTSTILYAGQLELDHIDGDHINNTPSNVQTLCKNCHSYKSWKQGDFRQGRRQ